MAAKIATITVTIISSISVTPQSWIREPYPPRLVAQFVLA